MKKILLVVLIIAVGTMLAGCGGDGSSSQKSSSSLVSITVGDNGRTAKIKVGKNTFIAKAGMLVKNAFKSSEALAAIPEGIVRILFTISAPDMETITREVVISEQSTITETFTVPNGNNRLFLVEAKDASGNTLYRNETSANLNGSPVTLSLDMQDVFHPTITSATLENVDWGEGTTSQITINFSEPMDGESIINTDAYNIACSGDCSDLGIMDISPGTDNRSVVLTLSYNYQCYMTFDLTVFTTVSDLAGNRMEEDYAWTHHTGCEEF